MVFIRNPRYEISTLQQAHGTFSHASSTMQGCYESYDEILSFYNEAKVFMLFDYRNGLIPNTYMKEYFGSIFLGCQRYNSWKLLINNYVRVSCKALFCLFVYLLLLFHQLLQQIEKKHKHFACVAIRDDHIIVVDCGLSKVIFVSDGKIIMNTGQSTSKKLVQVEQVERNTRDQFMVIASYGVWSVFNEEELQEFILHQLTITHDIKRICEMIIEACYNKNSIGNISIHLILFENIPAIVIASQISYYGEIVRLIKTIEAITENWRESVTIEMLLKTLETSVQVKKSFPGLGHYNHVKVILETYLKQFPLIAQERKEKNTVHALYGI